MNKQSINGLIILVLLLVSACGEDFTSLSPESQRNVADFYQTASDFETAINGAYGALQLSGTFGKNYILMMEMRADNSFNGGGPTGLAASIENIDRFDEIATAEEISSTWTDSYQGITRSNTILARLEQAEIDQALKDRIRGEALFIRSLLYYNLAVMYGNIPLQLEEVTGPNDPINQVSASEIYNQIITDLETAAGLLPESYSGDDIGRATSGAAATLLGRVHLTAGNAGEAETALRSVVQSNQYQLLPNYEDIWGLQNENNAESIFEVQFKAGGLGEGSIFTDMYTVTEAAVGGGNAPQDVTVGVPSAISDAYEAGDLRMDATYDTTSASNTQDPNEVFVKKFDGPRFSALDGELNFIVFRYADVLLMLAEAIGESQEAYDLINEVRNRAGLGNISTATPGTFEEKLLQERRVELAFENHRWPDLLRFGVAKETMSSHLGVSESEITLLYPIPQRELDVVPDELQQNPEHQ